MHSRQTQSNLKKSEPANRMAADFSGGECAIVKVFLMVM
jgi:hypothetical protein